MEMSPTPIDVMPLDRCAFHNFCSTFADQKKERCNHTAALFFYPDIILNNLIIPT
jgi:hypothetical protein